MFVNMIWDIFGFGTGSRIIESTMVIAVLLSLNGIILSIIYYKKANSNIKVIAKSLPDDAEELFRQRSEALRNRKKSSEANAKYIAASLKAFEKMDDLVADGITSEPTFSVTSSFGIYSLIAPLGLITSMGKVPKLGFKMLAAGQILLLFTAPNGFMSIFFLVGAVAIYSLLSAKYESTLNRVNSKFFNASKASGI